MKDVRLIADLLWKEGTIHIKTVARNRGRPGTIYQLTRFTKTPIKSYRSPHRHSTHFKELVRDYLIGRGHSYRQLVRKFGEDVKEYLSDDFLGFNLFQQVNSRNEHSFILLPKPLEPVILQKRDWQYHIGLDDKGQQQPYLLVQLPESAFQEGRNFGRAIRIAPIFDVHFGNKMCRIEKFEHYLKWIEETPGLYAILGGDLMENALDDGRGMVWDQTHSPQTQLDLLTEMLAPTAHKCLFAMPGNHERRTFLKSGIDPARILAERLEIPYFSGPVLVSILAGGHKWKIYAFHGFSNAGTKGGKLNAAGRPQKFNDFVNFFLSGHTHDPIADSETVLREDPEKCRLNFAKTWTCVAQSFMSWGAGYAYEKGYGPPGGGGLILELYDDGEYLASLR